MGGSANPQQAVATPQGANPFQQAAGAQSGALAGTQQAMMGAQQAMNYGVPQNATTGFQSAIDYTPQQVQATSYQAAQQGTPATAASQMANYQNPYETQVVQQTLDDVRQNVGAAALRGKAFGGSRHGTLELNNMADAAARMRQQGFGTALGAAQFDVGQQTAADARNVAAENVARQFGARQGMTAQQLNQAAGLQGAGLNLRGAQAMSNADLAAQKMRLSGAQQLGSSSQQLSGLGQRSFGYGTSIQDRMAGQGAQERGIQQALIDAARGQYGQYTGAPAQGLNTMLGAITGAGVPGTAGSATSYRPGLFNYLQVLSQFA